MLTTTVGNANIEYKFDGFRFYVAPAVGAGAVVAGKIVWDVVLSKIVQEIAKEIGKGVGQELIKRLFGSSNQDVAKRLTEISQKLDQVIASIEGLKTFIVLNGIQDYKNEAAASIESYMMAIGGHLRGAAAAGKLEGKDEELMTAQVAAFTISLGTLIARKAQNVPICLPMFLSIQAGLTMLVLSQRILHVKKTTTLALLEGYQRHFDEWIAILESSLRTMTPGVEAEGTALISFPRQGTIGYGNTEIGVWEGGGIEFAKPFYSLVATIDGNVAEPFRLIKIERLQHPGYPDQLMWDQPEFGVWYASPSIFSIPNVTAFGFGQSVVEGREGLPAANSRALILVNELNNRRDALLKQIDVLAGLREAVTSIQTGTSQLRTLV